MCPSACWCHRGTAFSQTVSTVLTHRYTVCSVAMQSTNCSLHWCGWGWGCWRFPYLSCYYFLRLPEPLPALEGVPIVLSVAWLLPPRCCLSSGVAQVSLVLGKRIKSLHCAFTDRVCLPSPTYTGIIKARQFLWGKRDLFNVI